MSTVEAVRQDSFTAPDGSRVTLQGDKVDLSGAWTCLFVVRADGVRHAFRVISRGQSDFDVTTRLGATWQSEQYRMGELAIAHGNGETFAAWRGRWHELQLTEVGTADRQHYTRVFDALAWTDRPDGMLVRGASAGRVNFEPFVLFKDVPGVGDLKIERPGKSAAELPAWRGAMTRNGEMWRQPLGDGAAGRARPESLVIATPTAVAELMPGPAGEHTADADIAARTAKALAVAWEPA